MIGERWKYDRLGGDMRERDRSATERDREYDGEIVTETEI